MFSLVEQVELVRCYWHSSEKNDECGLMGLETSSFWKAEGSYGIVSNDAVLLMSEMEMSE